MGHAHDPSPGEHPLDVIVALGGLLTLLTDPSARPSEADRAAFIGGLIATFGGGGDRAPGKQKLAANLLPA